MADDRKTQSEVDKRGYYNEADIKRIMKTPEGRKRFADVKRESKQKTGRKK